VPIIKPKRNGMTLSHFKDKELLSNISEFEQLFPTLRTDFGDGYIPEASPLKLEGENIVRKILFEGENILTKKKMNFQIDPLLLIPRFYPKKKRKRKKHINNTKPQLVKIFSTKKKNAFPNRRCTSSNSKILPTPLPLKKNEQHKITVDEKCRQQDL